MVGVVACTCNPATLEAEIRNGDDSTPVGGNSLLIFGWIVWPSTIQHKKRSLSKYQDLTADLTTNRDSKSG